VKLQERNWLKSSVWFLHYSLIANKMEQNEAKFWLLMIFCTIFLLPFGIDSSRFGIAFGSGWQWTRWKEPFLDYLSFFDTTISLTHSLSLYPSLLHTHTLSPFSFITLTFSYISLSLFLSLSLSHTHTHTHTHTQHTPTFSHLTSLWASL